MINVKRFLKENSDLRYAEFNKKFINTRYPIIGVRLPTLQKFAKEIEPEYIEFDENLSHEEIMLYIYCAGCFKTENEQLEYLQNILPYIDNWATCDCTGALKMLKGEKSFQFFSKLLKSDKEFEVRVGIIGFMKNFLKTEKLNEILAQIKEIKSDAYYVKMGISWFYAELCAFNSELAVEEIKKTQDKFIRNKSISKAKESFRVSATTKAELEKLRMK